METLNITKKNAAAAYNVADANGKKLLELLLGKDNVIPMKITDRVQSFDDVLRIAGKTMGDIHLPGDTDDEVAYKQIKLIAEVYNEGTVLNPLDQSQYKYYPWHKISGSGLSSDGFGCWRSLSFVGVRLCFKSSDLAIDAGKKFIDIYTRLKIK